MKYPTFVSSLYYLLIVCFCDVIFLDSVVLRGFLKCNKEENK